MVDHFAKLYRLVNHLVMDHDVNEDVLLEYMTKAGSTGEYVYARSVHDLVDIKNCQFVINLEDG